MREYNFVIPMTGLKPEPTATGGQNALKNLLPDEGHLRVPDAWNPDEAYDCRVLQGVDKVLLIRPSPSPVTTSVWRVSATHNHLQNGLSWNTAYNSIQPAIDAAYAAGGGHVWVAEGTYTGTGAFVIEMRTGVSVYGGFAGTETAFGQRGDVTAHPSIIDGEHMRCGVMGAYNAEWQDAELNGFLIQNGLSTVMSGGGMGCNGARLAVRRCVFSNNTSLYGGGIFVMGTSQVQIQNCIFHDNNATQFAGSPFSGNGGAIAINNSTVSVINCTLFRNYAEYKGGAIVASNLSTTAVRNTIVRGNSADEADPQFHIVNVSGFSANSSRLQATLQTGSNITGASNTVGDPLFVSEPEPMNLQLRTASPCINTGSSGTNVPDHDIRGVTRPQHGLYDIGAYEFDGPI